MDEKMNHKTSFEKLMREESKSKSKSKSKMKVILMILIFKERIEEKAI